MSGDFLHEACLYAGDDELKSLMIPFAREAAAAGEPILFALGDRSRELLTPELGDVEGVTFIPSAYAQPAGAVRALLECFDAHVAQGNGGRLRIVGEILASTPLEWEPWARYEAAGNRIFADYPAWAVCIYDTRTTPAQVLAEVTRTHPQIATADGRHRPNDHYQQPEAFLRCRPAPPGDPLEHSAPDIELINPAPAAARRALAQLAARAQLDQAAVDDFVLGVNEVVTNAHLHGRLPAVLRLWAADDRLHATVNDAGPGPTDPFAGLRPSPRPADGQDSRGLGLGLWMTHQLCGHVTHSTDPHDGFTIRLTTGA